MSQAQPFQPNLNPDDPALDPDAGQGIPAADPGPGAPPTAPGFGEGYEPSDEDDDGAAADPSDAERIREESNAFRPPDPDDVGR
ncbi:hypothetical protein PU560_03070 [Georgenia sp. 10Sc9-8]|uniref:Uncharacterized protein n=1 Tax=Georgenia halotolerans TaxID=3028317 RepID=A0ABT5TW01_9MICO|nr:hypothetical protein [Georgenia halotolerans]